jgi:hypothetical protein
MSEDIGNEIAKDYFSDFDCPISLYHATSTLFLDSIEKYGLGGLNIIKEWNVLAFVKEIYPYAQNCPIIQIGISLAIWLVRQQWALISNMGMYIAQVQKNTLLNFLE